MLAPIASLDWLTARPVAHRGLHNAAAGVIENTPSAVSAAISAGYAIEVDLQVTADGEAMVYHDGALGRLTQGEGRLDRMNAADLKRVPFKATSDHMMTLGELLDLVGGRVTLVLELKSRSDGDRRLVKRVAKVLRRYAGHVAAMSFDLAQVETLREICPELTRGVVAEQFHPPAHGDETTGSRRDPLAYLLHGVRSRPQFVAYHVKDLPAALPLVTRYVLGLPLLTWTVRTEEDRQRAERWADQMIFEGFRP